MNFGDLVQPAESVDVGLWIAPACTGESGTVGDLIPGHFEALARVLPPDPEDDDSSDDADWWLDYRAVFEQVVAVGQAHTDTPGEAFFATWEGHGFANFSTVYTAWPSSVARWRPSDWKRRRADKKVRAELGEKDRQDKIAIREELAKYPRLEHPIRAYYLTTGPLSAVLSLRYPGPETSRDDWRNPDLIWPEDRSWIVVTDVDFWSLYVAGSTSFVNDLLETMPDQAVKASWSEELPIED